MAWSANLIYKKPNLANANVELKIEFTNGNLSFTEIFFIKNLNFDSFKNMIRQRLNSLDNIQNLYTNINTGSFDVSQPSTPSVPEDETNFINDLSLLKRLTNGYNLAVVGSDLSYLVNTKIRVTSGLLANLNWNKYL